MATYSTNPMELFGPQAQRTSRSTALAGGMQTRPTGATPVSVPKPTSAPVAPGATAVPGGSIIKSQAPAAPPGGYQLPTGYNDLRGQVFTPQQSANTGLASGYVNQAAGRLMGYQLPSFQSVAPANYGQAQGYMGQAAGQLGGMRIGTYGAIPVNNYGQSYGLLDKAQGVLPDKFNPAGDTTSVREMVLKALQGAQGPDRAGLAAQAFQLMRDSTEPQYQQDLRTVGQKNAALGRIGSGMVTNQLMDVTAQRERDLSQAQKELANEAAGQTLADKLAALNAGQSVLGQFGGEDRANTGVNLDLSSALAGLGQSRAALDSQRRNEQVGERDFQFNRDTTAANLAGQRAGILGNLAGQAADIATNQYGQRAAERNAGLDYGLNSLNAQRGVFGDMMGLEGQRFNEDVSNANQMRTERDFQDHLSQEAIQNALQQQLTQDQLYGNDFDRQLRAAQVYGGLGFGDTGAGTLMAGAGQYGDQAGQTGQGISDSMQAWNYLNWLRQQQQGSMPPSVNI